MVAQTNNPDFLQSVFDSINAGSEEGMKQRKQIGTDGLPLFELNCEIWLDPILKEMDELAEATFVITSAGSVKFIKVFRWHGIEGHIISFPWAIGWSTYPRAASWIEFVLVDPLGEKAPRKVNIKLPSLIASPNATGKYDEQAQPIEKTPLSSLLVEVAMHREKVSRYAMAESQRIMLANLQQMENGLKECHDIPTVQKWLATAQTVFPDHLDRWNAASKRRSDEIIAIAIQRKAAEEEAAAILAEEKQLEEQAAALFRPFTVYRLRLAIQIPGEQKPFFTHVYTTAPVPDEAGYYVEVNHGDLVNGYRPEAAIADLHRVDIDSPDHPDAPNVCRHVEFEGTQSIKSFIALATPEGLG
jgi:hypothetical protein